MLLEQDIMKKWEITEKKPLVSICCLTFNHESYIKEALDSFLSQKTTFPFEVLIHDDASIDNTNNIVREYEKQYPNIVKGIYQEENQFSKNIDPFVTFVIPASKGEYIAICDGDDYWIDENKLQIQIDMMRMYPKCYICFHPVYQKNNQSSNFDKVLNQYSNIDKTFTTAEVILGRGGFCATSSIILKRKSIENLPKWLYSLDYLPKDYFLQMYASLNGGALYINNIMSIYRVGVDNSWCDLSRKDSLRHKKILLATNKSLLIFKEGLDEKLQLSIDNVIHLNNSLFIKRRVVEIFQRKEIFSLYKNNFSFIEKLLWHLVYKNPRVHTLLAYIRNSLERN